MNLPSLNAGKKVTYIRPNLLGGSIELWSGLLQADTVVLVDDEFYQGSVTQQETTHLVYKQGGDLAPVTAIFKPVNGPGVMRNTYLACSENFVEYLSQIFCTLYPDTVCKEIWLRDRILQLLAMSHRQSAAHISRLIIELLWEHLIWHVPGRKIEVSSSMGMMGQPTYRERMVALCKAVGGECYIHLPVNAPEIDPMLFTSEGMGFALHAYLMQPYKVSENAENRNSKVSILDALFRLGREKTLELLEFKG